MTLGKARWSVPPITTTGASRCHHQDEASRPDPSLRKGGSSALRLGYCSWERLSIWSCHIVIIFFHCFFTHYQVNFPCYRSSSEIYETVPTDVSLGDDLDEPLSPVFPDDQPLTPSDDSDIYSHIDNDEEEHLMKPSQLKKHQRFQQGKIFSTSPPFCFPLLRIL